jgi:hypothetical protein
MSGWCSMRLLFSLLAVCCLVFSVSIEAAAQAAAESALTHALSSTAGTSLGKAMGNATGQLAGKLGQQTANAVTPKKNSVTKLGSSAVVKAPATPNAGSSASGSLIASIQGAGSQPLSCSPAKPTEGNPAKTDAAVTQPSAAAGRTNCSSPASQEAETHPSVLNLPAAK